MYVMLIFALVLISPLPFISPFENVMPDAAAQSPFSSFDVDPESSSKVQPQDGPAFALLPNTFETEPTYGVEHITGYTDISLTEYEGTVYAIVSGIGAFVEHINITDLNNIAFFNQFSVRTVYEEYPDTFSIRDHAALSDGMSPYMILTGASGSSDPGSFRVIQYTLGNITLYPAALSEVYDDTTYTNLDFAGGVDIVTLGASTYAVVASFYDGVQIIDVTNPSLLSPVFGISDGDVDSNGNTFTTLAGAYRVTITTIDSSTYALVSAIDDNGRT